MNRLIATLRRRATKAMASLPKEIARREKELETLRAEAARWSSVLDGETQVATTPAAPSPARATKRPRLDWSAVLTELPARFTAKDVADKAGKPIDQVYAYLSRWMKDKKVRRGKEGYRKISAARPRRPREKTVLPVQQKKPGVATTRRAGSA